MSNNIERTIAEQKKQLKLSIKRSTTAIANAKYKMEQSAKQIRFLRKTDSVVSLKEYGNIWYEGFKADFLFNIEVSKKKDYEDRLRALEKNTEKPIAKILQFKK